MGIPDPSLQAAFQALWAVVAAGVEDLPAVRADLHELRRPSLVWIPSGLERPRRRAANQRQISATFADIVGMSSVGVAQQVTQSVEVSAEWDPTRRDDPDLYTWPVIAGVSYQVRSEGDVPVWSLAGSRVSMGEAADLPLLDSMRRWMDGMVSDGSMVGGFIDGGHSWPPRVPFLDMARGSRSDPSLGVVGAFWALWLKPLAWKTVEDDLGRIGGVVVQREVGGFVVVEGPSRPVASQSFEYVRAMEKLSTNGWRWGDPLRPAHDLRA